MDLRTWLVDNGGYIHPSLEITSLSSGYSVHVRAGHCIEAGAKVVYCPHKCTLSYADSRKYGLVSGKTFNSSLLPQTVATRLFLIKQYLLKEKSFWWPYVKCLPQPNDKDALNTPLWYDNSDLLWLQGTNLGAAATGRKTLWRQEFDHALALLFPEPCDARDQWTWHLYLWAATILTSRSFPPSSLSIPDLESPVLIPGLDLLNHSPSANVTWLWDATECTIVSQHFLTEGSEVFNNYGLKGNEELLMGYGFCLPDNRADRFGLSFNSTVSRMIRGLRARRVVAEQGNDQDSHWVRLNVDQQSDQNSVSGSVYQFSPGFLADFSIAVENDRERKTPTTWAHVQKSFSAAGLCRNKLRVLNAAIMLLLSSQADIRQHDKNLPKSPQNRRQKDAAIYRQGQLRILDGALKGLQKDLGAYLDHSPSNGVVRLEHVLSQSPKKLSKDFRNVVLAGLGTRDASKIAQWGGEEFAFSLWLCGLWLIGPLNVQQDDSAFDERTSQWLNFLTRLYGEMPTEGVNGKTRQSDSMVDSADIVASYVEAVNTAVEKQPKSVYNDSRLISESLEWCLHCVRQEGVRCPRLDAGNEDEGEYLLFMEGNT